MTACVEGSSAAVSWSNLHAVTTTNSGSSNYFFLVSAGPSTAVKTEHHLAGSQATGDAGAVAPYHVWATLIDASQGLVWTCDTSTKDLRPECLDPSAFHRLFEDALRSRAFSQATITVLPESPGAETLVARVDVRLPAKGGKASVGIAVFNCCFQKPPPPQPQGLASGSPPTSPMAQVFQTLCGRMSALAQSHALLETCQKDLASAKALAEASIEAKLLSEKKLVQGCITLLNEKKEKIRELVDAVNKLTQEAQSAKAALELERSRRCGRGGDSSGTSDGEADGEELSGEHHADDAEVEEVQQTHGQGLGLQRASASEVSETSLCAGDSSRKRPRTSTEDLLNLF